MRTLNIVRDRTAIEAARRATASGPTENVPTLKQFPELLQYPYVKHEFSSVIFDFDGTLGNSMWVWDDMDRLFCDKYGIELPETEPADLAIMSFEDTAAYFIEQLGVKMTVEEICAQFNELAYERYANEVELMPGVKEYLEILKQRGTKMAIATALSWPLLEAAMKHRGIEEYFSDIAFCDESYSKHRPDVFLLAASRIRAKPEECLVFEDTPLGLGSARSVGMTACGVFDASRCSGGADAMASASDFYIEDYWGLVREANGNV